VNVDDGWHRLGRIERIDNVQLVLVPALFVVYNVSLDPVFVPGILGEKRGLLSDTDDWKISPRRLR
jgi:hypothetical protein